MPRNSDAAGDWQGLDAPIQAARYRAIAGMIEDLPEGARVLDVGCGEAVLRAYLPAAVRYTGVESSALALAAARQQYPYATFFHQKAESFQPRDERFDAIVFNEMLYYTANPVGLLSSFASFLAGRGFIVCSVFQKPERRSLKAWVRSLTGFGPFPNIECERRVRAFMNKFRWTIIEDRIVEMPGGGGRCWHVWKACSKL